MTRDKKLEALVMVIWVVAVLILILLVWQFFLGPLYEAEKRIGQEKAKNGPLAKQALQLLR